MIDWTELRGQLTTLRPALVEWEIWVRATLEARAKVTMSRETSLQFATGRVKEVASALSKIQRKGYTDPLVQLTDLAGVRFITLLSTDVQELGTLLEAEPSWTFELSRDPDLEMAADPERFQYQSRHYLVRSKAEQTLNGVTVPAGLTCEVQIRTLLQHAYAEMVHDSIYKATGKVPPGAIRYAASSMALMETADHLLCETMRLLREDSASIDGVLEGLANIYSSQVHSLDEPVDVQLNRFVIEELRSELPADVTRKVSSFLSENDYLAQNIRNYRHSADPFWLQPISVLAYWLVHHDRDTANKWPLALSMEALQQVYSDLGISMHPH
ncbi:hypothetical protein EYW45_14765 [Achromobacter sp. KS-M25]|nr:hypothetical protein [Achromobacter aestuarii]